MSPTLERLIRMYCLGTVTVQLNIFTAANIVFHIYISHGWFLARCPVYVLDANIIRVTSLFCASQTFDDVLHPTDITLPWAECDDSLCDYTAVSNDVTFTCAGR